MDKIIKGDIVGRKSYKKDIIFKVSNIIKQKNEYIAILKGLYERIEADSNISDLEKVEKVELRKYLQEINNKVRTNLNENSREEIGNFKNNRIRKKVITGKILHLDGDRRYSQKSYRYYKESGLSSVVKNIPEYRQPSEVYGLLKIYAPDVLVVTGHDGMIKKGRDYTNIYNYRNSKYFIDTVKEARRYERENFKDLVIFAGACQSYYEAIINAGANFASSPARILIDFIDPLKIAEKVATTDNSQYITAEDISQIVKNGKDGISGIGGKGKKVIYYNIAY